jgi:hypothetical protein
MKYILLLLSLSFYGQDLHHQVIASQGTTKILANGIVVSQTIGQQSTIGNSNKTFIIIQGFQQSLWNNLISSNNQNNIKTTTYPNPFIDSINFEFSEFIDQEVELFIFDASGRVVFNETQQPLTKILTFKLNMMSGQQYFVRLRSNNFTYYTKIVKQL